MVKKFSATFESGEIQIFYWRVYLKKSNNLMNL